MRKKILNKNNLDNLNEILKKKLLKIELLDNKKKIDFLEILMDQYFEPEDEEDLLNDPGFGFNKYTLDADYWEKRYPGFIEWGAIDFLIKYNNLD